MECQYSVSLDRVYMKEFGETITQMEERLIHSDVNILGRMIKL